jgi:hypothetical protein
MKFVSTSLRGRHSVIMTLAWLIVVGSCFAQGACGEPGTAPSPVSAGAPRPAVEIDGYVNDTAFQPLPTARVEVLDGPQSGTATITDAGGRFSLKGEFTAATRFRAAKDGYQAAIQTLQPSTTIPPSSQSLTFFMSVAGASGNHATLTVDVDAACAELPNDLRTRTYPATLVAASFPPVPANTAFYAMLSSASLDGYFHFVSIRVDGDRVSFDLSDNGIEDEVAPETYYFVGGYGSAIVHAGAKTISGPFSGVVDYCVVKSDPGTMYPCSDQAITRVRCSSANHRMSLTWQ